MFLDVFSMYFNYEKVTFLGIISNNILSSKIKIKSVYKSNLIFMG